MNGKGEGSLKTGLVLEGGGVRGIYAAGKCIYHSPVGPSCDRQA